MKKTLIITVDVPETMETDESVVVTISDTDGCMYDFIGVIEGIAKEIRLGKTPYDDRMFR